VYDVGHFSPAIFGLPSGEGVGHRVFLLLDESRQRFAVGRFNKSAFLC
jgi:hypothetical protein